jgi:hypothetical protein
MRPEGAAVMSALRRVICRVMGHNLTLAEALNGKAPECPRCKQWTYRPYAQELNGRRLYSPFEFPPPPPRARREQAR